MLSSMDLERLITVKRREIEKEKALLGLLSPPHALENEHNKENVSTNNLNATNVSNTTALCKSSKDDVQRKSLYDFEENIPADLEKYIRRYVGLPVMLKTGEYSPNNPLLRGDRHSRRERDVFLGLGEYEERKKSLRRLRQQEYKEYLDQQAKKKQEEKEKAERELMIEEERERKWLAEEREKDRLEAEGLRRRVEEYSPSRVDTGIQCDNGLRKPSIAVQTDETEIIHLSKQNSPKLTQAERELSPRTVIEMPKNDQDERPIKPALWQELDGGEGRGKPETGDDVEVRRRSYGDFYEKKTNRDKLMSDLRHTYMPSIFDADVIHMRNVKAEKDEKEKRQCYQQELKSQIQEQQRIREERKAREKMLELAEMRRLEEQLRMLGAARTGHDRLAAKVTESGEDYDRKRKELQQEIDDENRNLFRSKKVKTHATAAADTNAQHKPPPSKLPFYYKTALDRSGRLDKPFSTNIPETSIFSPNYDVDSYLRKNLTDTAQRTGLGSTPDRCGRSSGTDKRFSFASEVNDRNSPERTSFLSESVAKNNVDTLPIPVLRHSPRLRLDLVSDARNGANGISDAMRVVEDKWKVPAVQRNILKSLPNNEGGSVNILTQLGSIRRQLQLEQLKLDKMLGKDGGG